MNFPPNPARVEADQGQGEGANAGAPQAPGGASRDAESGNTASHGCDREQGDGALQVLWRGWDTLEVSFPGEISADLDDELRRLKALAQAPEVRHQAQAQIKLGERYFEVADRGGGRMFAYLLRHPDMRIALASAKAKRVPLALITLQNQFLVTKGPLGAVDEARAVLSKVGEVQLSLIHI